MDADDAPPVAEPGPVGVDPDDVDASSGACGCILAAVALILIVGVLYACAESGPGRSTCG